MNGKMKDSTIHAWLAFNAVSAIVNLSIGVVSNSPLNFGVGLFCLFAMCLFLYEAIKRDNKRIEETENDPETDD